MHQVRRIEKKSSPGTGNLHFSANQFVDQMRNSKEFRSVQVSSSSGQIVFLTKRVFLFDLKVNRGKDYIEFQNGNGCYSFVGRDGEQAKQAIVLFERCAEEHTLIHEVHCAIKNFL